MARSTSCSPHAGKALLWPCFICSSTWQGHRNSFLCLLFSSAFISMALMCVSSSSAQFFKKWSRLHHYRRANPCPSPPFAERKVERLVWFPGERAFKVFWGQRRDDVAEWLQSLRLAGWESWILHLQALWLRQASELLWALALLCIMWE